MKLVVLGATGALGSHVIRQALGAGHEVTAYVRDARKLSASESSRASSRGHFRTRPGSRRRLPARTPW
jgi:uncharacterized protein YbjT (DUF2867 family)